LEQKEETVARFEKLLKQVRMEFDAEMGKKQEEIVSLKSAIRNQSQTIQTLKSSALLTNATYEHNQNPSAVIRDKMERIEDLEDEVLEMQSSIRFGFCGLNFLSILSHFLSQEKLTQKN
jgi:phage-related tail protein